MIGPFPADEHHPTPENTYSRSNPSSLGTSLSNPSTSELARFASRSLISASVTKGEWHHASIASIRNLRLPVHTLDAGQVGTIGIVFDAPPEDAAPEDDVFEVAIPRIRKGMVMAIPSQHMIQTGHSLQAASGFTASFQDSDINFVTPGSLVVIYIASVRGTARVLRVSANNGNDDNISSGTAVQDDEDDEDDDGDDVFGLEGLGKEEETEPVTFGLDGIAYVTLELITNREWIELGSQVLVMPGGGTGLYTGSERGEKGVAGLEGFVGKVVEVVD